MPSYLDMIAKAAGKIVPSTSSAKTASTHPTQIRNQFYNNMREFTAWHPWGDKPNHTKRNDGYIPMKDRFVKQFDYSTEMKNVMELGWKASNGSIGPKNLPKMTLGAARPMGPNAAAINAAKSPLRRGLGHAVVNYSDFDHITKFEQVAAYAFRGDSRTPEQIQAADGFHPPASRTDSFYQETIANHFMAYLERKEGVKLQGQAAEDFKQKVLGYIRGKGEAGRKFAEYEAWRTLLSKEEMHIKYMTGNSFLKAYVSGTRDVTFAKEASSGIAGGAGAVKTLAVGNGFVYVLRIKSGFMLKPGVGGLSIPEGEIAHLGPIKWKNVYGFRNVADGEDVYIRNMFDQEDNAAFKLVLASLSNIHYTKEVNA